MINDLNFNRQTTFTQLMNVGRLILLRFVRVHSTVNSVRLMFMGTRENIVLPNDSMSPLMH